ncbi:hypothetical protein D0861_03893 [Hortaea werneckii]|uniref:Uncharacterized protein n=1 Tax=Hortaea werneckii TaxID=91943 RepID=A0A3M7FME9_HORWE|nr:hypothetical protein D0861_03893 [Hortaea werneckii]
MAMLQNSNYSNSSSNYYGRRASSESSRRSNTQASAYAVDASTMALTGFHYSTCGAGASGWRNTITAIVSGRRAHGSSASRPEGPLAERRRRASHHGRV